MLHMQEYNYTEYQCGCDLLQFVWHHNVVVYLASLHSCECNIVFIQHLYKQTFNIENQNYIAKCFDYFY